MSKKNILSIEKIKFLFIFCAVFLLTFATNVAGQVVPVRPTPAPVPKEDFTWWYVSLFVLILGLLGAIFWWMNSKKTNAVKTAAPKAKEARAVSAKMADDNDFDADKELEWLRKNQKLVGKKSAPKAANRKRPARPPKSGKVSEPIEAKLSENSFAATQAAKENAKNVEETPAANLPVFSIKRLELARPFAELPISDDESLMNAIEQMLDEFEEDESVRELTLRVLAAFRTKNSVEALSQAALYDLSSSLRSKAVAILADFDHESVFEAILLANADPTREVRAAAARGLSKLTFDRADAWTRIAETDDEGRIRQAARAAVESGFVDMSFDRLIHPDYKYAYEAFALMALLIKSGETEKIFNALETNKNMNVRRAVLHTIKITRDEKTLDKLYLMLEQKTLPLELQEQIDKTIEEVGFVMT